MRTVLCYGDSNTWGAATVAAARRPLRAGRALAGRAARRARRDWMVIEEGLGGRTTVSDDPVEGIPTRTAAPTCRRACAATGRSTSSPSCSAPTISRRASTRPPWEIAAGRRRAGRYRQDGRRRPQRRRARDPRRSARRRSSIACPLHADLFAGAPREVAARWRAHYRARRRRNGRPFPRRRRGDQVERASTASTSTPTPTPPSAGPSRRRSASSASGRIRTAAGSPNPFVCRGFPSS